MPDSHYRGRFAPSPTGALHLGSLLTAVASFLDARSHGGEWLLRMEDLDPPRETPGAAAGILRTLERFGLYWDGEVLYQSRRSEAYRHTLERLSRAGLVYPCACSRREIRENTLPGAAVSVYPGTCRPLDPAEAATLDVSGLIMVRVLVEYDGQVAAAEIVCGSDVKRLFHRLQGKWRKKVRRG